MVEDLAVRDVEDRHHRGQQVADLHLPEGAAVLVAIEAIETGLMGMAIETGLSRRG